MTSTQVIGLGLVIVSLIIAVAEYVAKVRMLKEKEDNELYNDILDLIYELMGEAEEIYHYGEDKKRWVLNKLQEKLETIGITIDEETIDILGNWIDDAMTYINKFAHKE